MLGLTRRQKMEGWAIDVSETSAQVGRFTLRQRLAENNRLWIVCLIAVVAIALYMVRHADGVGVGEDNLAPVVGRAQDNFDDAVHRRFESAILARYHGKQSVVDARFVDRETFRVVVSSGTTLDDAQYLARVIGMRIVHEFHYRPVVQAFVMGRDGTSRLVATARWETTSSGFVTGKAKAGRPR